MMLDRNISCTIPDVSEAFCSYSCNAGAEWVRGMRAYYCLMIQLYLSGLICCRKGDNDLVDDDVEREEGLN
jgi:hypothetical protein